MATKQETALAIRGMVEKRIENSAAIIKAAGYDPEQYAAVVLNAMVVNPSLAECTKQSLEKSIIDCLNLGLLPDGKEAAIVPFKSGQSMNATLVPMVGGMVKLAHNAVKGAVHSGAGGLQGRRFRLQGRGENHPGTYAGGFL